MLEVSIDAVRKLAVEAQHLHHTYGGSPAELVEELGCIQIDPISVVAPTQHLVLAARAGRLDLDALDRALWDERSLFHYWAHAASIVATTDYPIHSYRMRTWLRRETTYRARIKEWLEANALLRRSILRQLRARGPLRSRDIVDRTEQGWRSSGWTNERNVNKMLEILWIDGTVTIAGRAGQERVWELSERWFPEWTPRRTLGPVQVTEAAVLRSLKALGAATPVQIARHFTRDSYPALQQVVGRLSKRGTIEPVRVVGESGALRGAWFVHARDAQRLRALEHDEWSGRTVLLSPFDNLICDRARTEQLWDFRYRLEIYTPKEKRVHGYYVLPFLHHDRLIGRVDLAADRRARVLRALSMHAEDGAPAAGSEVARALGDLARALGLQEVRLPRSIPRAWRNRART